DRGLDRAAELSAVALQVHLHVLERLFERLHVADALVARRRRGLADDRSPLFVDDDDVGHCPPGITCYERASHRLSLCLLGCVIQTLGRRRSRWKKRRIAERRTASSSGTMRMACCWGGADAGAGGGAWGRAGGG